jgi:hypothetical protein
MVWNQVSTTLQENVYNFQTRRKLTVRVQGATMKDPNALPTDDRSGTTSQYKDTIRGTPQNPKVTGAPPPNVPSADSEAAGGKAGPTPTAMLGKSSPQPEVITNVWIFKRRQELYPSLK